MAERNRIHRESDPTKSDTAPGEPARTGDVLGISETPPEVEIPRATEDRGGNPAGIDVRTPATGSGELKQSSGATSIDMGAGGTGTTVDPSRRRPATRDETEP